MLTRILGWFGWKSRHTPARAPGRPSRPGSATAHLFEKRSIKPQAEQRGNVEAGGDFNPYNTGKFDRSASWERISKNQR